MISHQILMWMLIAAAGAQLIIALLNLRLVSLLGWSKHLEQLPLLMRQVFHVHAWFVSLTLGIFAVLTLRFVGDLAGSTSPFARWFAGAVASFWGMRTVVQVAYYSAEHWRGKRGPTVVHVALLITYGVIALLYGVVAVSGGSHGR